MARRQVRPRITAARRPMAGPQINPEKGAFLGVYLEAKTETPTGRRGKGSPTGVPGFPGRESQIRRGPPMHRLRLTLIVVFALYALSLSAQKELSRRRRLLSRGRGKSRHRNSPQQGRHLLHPASALSGFQKGI